MQRSLEPEMLDGLPPTHPDAVHNRRDLRLTNLAMGNHAWMSRVVPRQVRAGERALEVGAGTGELGLRLAGRGVLVDGLDLWPRPKNWPRGHDWHQADLRSFGLWDRYAVVFGNLIFHQFSEAELRHIGRHLRHARAIIACEPLRRRTSQLAYRLIAPVFGANHVSLHDAHVSITAGFRQDELPRALGLAPSEWNIECTKTLRGAYRMVALRRETQ